MKITLIQKAIAILVISFFISPSVNSVHGQGFLKKLKDAAKKEVNKVISPTTPATTPPAVNQNNVPVNTAPANTSSDNNTTVNNNVWASDTIPKIVNPVRPTAPKASENNLSQQNIRNVFVSIWGINYELQTPLRNYLRDNTKGMYSFQEKSIGMTFFDIILTTSLNTSDLVNSLVKNIEAMNSKLLYHLIDTTNQQLVKITMSDKSFHYITKETKSITSQKGNGTNGIASTKPKTTIKTPEKDQTIKASKEDEQGNVIQAPVEDKGTQVVEAPKDDDDDKIYTKGFEPSFPGGDYGFSMYVRENLNTNILKKGAPAGTYRVIVKFIVAKDGSVRDVVAETKFGYGMEEEAIRLITGGPKWDRQYTGPVNSYMRQPITFIVTK